MAGLESTECRLCFSEDGAGHTQEQGQSQGPQRREVEAALVAAEGARAAAESNV